MLKEYLQNSYALADQVVSSLSTRLVDWKVRHVYANTLCLSEYDVTALGQSSVNQSYQSTHFLYHTFL